MATVHITLGAVTARAGNDAPLSIFDSIEDQAQTMNSSGSSQQSSLTSRKGLVWCITALDAVWVKFGDNPTAAQGTGHLIAAGTTRTFKVTNASEKLAILAAS